MAEPDKRPVTLEELLVSSLAQADALAKLLIEKGLITREEFMQKISEKRATYQRMLLNLMRLDEYPRNISCHRTSHYLRQSRRLAVCWPLKGAYSQTG